MEKNNNQVNYIYIYIYILHIYIIYNIYIIYIKIFIYYIYIYILYMYIHLFIKHTAFFSFSVLSNVFFMMYFFIPISNIMCTLFIHRDLIQITFSSIIEWKKEFHRFIKSNLYTTLVNEIYHIKYTFILVVSLLHWLCTAYLRKHSWGQYICIFLMSTFTEQLHTKELQLQ